ncbi:MAG: heparan-alpha-glucosaminide N-acetyltransferase domain-containing protein, partial [Candidatus Bathyarchaeia archaeon]
KDIPVPRSTPIDIFRGIAIALMILVNNQGGPVCYPLLQHATWNGWTPADLAFPFFLFICGVTIPYSIGRRLDQQHTRRKLLLTVLRRTSILFVLGLLINGFPYYELEKIRIMGVLQRVALCYLFSSLAYLSLRIRGWLVTTVLLLFGYWTLLTFIPVPGYGAGVLTPEGNLVKYVDSLVLGSHIFMYMGGFEPEGILSTIPSIATTLIGVMVGQHLRSCNVQSGKASSLLALGAACIVAGLLWDSWFPINKNLWTSSYVLLTCGIAMVLLHTIRYLIEVRGFVRWSRPFMILGMNSIAVYVLSELTDIGLSNSTFKLADGRKTSVKTFIYESFFAHWAGPLNGSLLYAIVYLIFLLWIAVLLYRRRIFIRI